MFISLYNICVFIITCRTKRTEKSPLSFFRQDRKEKGIFCSFHFTTYVFIIITGRTKRAEKLPFSSLGQNREEKGIVFVHFTLQHMCLHYYRQDGENMEISFFLSQVEQKGARNVSCYFYFTTLRFIFMISDSLSDIELRDLFEDS